MAAKPQGTPPDAPPEPLQDVDAPPVIPEKPNKKASKNRGEKRGKGAIIVIIIVVLLLGAIVAVLAFNIGGFREDVVMPYLRNAPLIGSFFPEPEEDPLAELTPEEIRAEHDRLVLENESLRAQVRLSEQQLAERDFRIQDLVRYYIHWNEFRIAQAQLGQVLAHHDPQSFLGFLIQHYHLIEVDHIPQLIQDAMRLAEFDEEVREMVRTFNNMDEASAGEVLEQWMLIDLSMMVRVLRAMSATLRGEIMDTLDPGVAANMLLLMSMPPPTFTPVVPYLRELPPIETVPVVPPAEVLEPEEDEYEYYEYEETEYDEEAEADDETEEEETIEEDEE